MARKKRLKKPTEVAITNGGPNPLIPPGPQLYADFKIMQQNKQLMMFSVVADPVIYRDVDETEQQYDHLEDRIGAVRNLSKDPSFLGFRDDHSSFIDHVLKIEREINRTGELRCHARLFDNRPRWPR